MAFGKKIIESLKDAIAYQISLELLDVIDEKEGFGDVIGELAEKMNLSEKKSEQLSELGFKIWKEAGIIGLKAILEFMKVPAEEAKKTLEEAELDLKNDESDN